MKKLFFAGAILLIVFEAANVYFIMPLPYSQRSHSIDVAYFLYTWRWIFRTVFAACVVVGVTQVWRGSIPLRVLALVTFAATTAVEYIANFKIAADKIFIAPNHVVMRPAGKNVVEPTRLVVGIEISGQSRAYPIQFIGYHHQVRDTVAGTPILVSYCTVCRTGRVFSPVIDGKVDNFRLVGMDHFNAMFEDKSTKTWWRQATGEAIAGPKKGKSLAEIPSQQLTLAQWLSLHPTSLIMQPDSALADVYPTSFDYETGASRQALTGTDTISWNEKAWVVGITLNGASKAYDWRRLRRERTVNDEVGGTPVVLAIGSDSSSFFAFERPDTATRFVLRGDSLAAGDRVYALSGRGMFGSLKPVSASQEFWHSWRTFHPATSKY